MRVVIYGDDAPVPTPEFLALTIPELMSEWRYLEQEKMRYHPESSFQHLIDTDMRYIAQRLKEIRKLKIR